LSTKTAVGKSQRFLVTATSASNPTRHDSVKASVTLKQAARPEEFRGVAENRCPQEQAGHGPE
jgi:hypothetical protein